MPPDHGETARRADESSVLTILEPCAEPASSIATEPTPTSAFRLRLLDAIAEAVRDHGYREKTVADVVRIARTSRRTFSEQTIQQISDAVDHGRALAYSGPTGHRGLDPRIASSTLQTIRPLSW